MITRLFVIFVAFASIAFVAFAAAMVRGGVNWENEADALGKDFVFEVSKTDTGRLQYALKHRATDQTIGQKTVILADLVVQAKKRQAEDAEKEKQRLTEEIAKLEPIIAVTKAAVVADTNGLDSRAQSLEAQLVAVSKQIKALTENIRELATQAQEIREEEKERREEVYRLRNQLELLRTDLFAFEEQQGLLQAELLQLTVERERLARRNKQLQQQVYDADDDE